MHSALRTEDFTDGHRVLTLFQDLPRDDNGRLQEPISDIVDDEGLQYVDLVMEGGGVLGIALLGYTYFLEQCGIRFLGVGGASAGAINALMLAAAGPPSAAKAAPIVTELARLDMASFVDGDRDVQKFVEALTGGAGKLRLAWRAVQVIDTLRKNLGLCPGEKFRDWVSEMLRRFGVRTQRELETLMNTVPKGLRRRDGTPLDVAAMGAELAIVAADVTTETKVVFPRMAALYWSDPTLVDPAVFVRASMSVPGFFEPLRIGPLPKGPAVSALWSRFAGYRGDLPPEVLFVDGGIVSNFPVDLFHAPGVPAAPTFGVRLGRERTSPRSVAGPLGLLGAVLDSARHNADYDFICKNPDYRRLVREIDTEPHHWLNFNLGDDAKLDLFRRGAEAAREFLIGFDWKEYKEIRRGTAGMPRAVEAVAPPPPAPVLGAPHVSP